MLFIAVSAGSDVQPQFKVGVAVTFIILTKSFG